MFKHIFIDNRRLLDIKQRIENISLLMLEFLLIGEEIKMEGRRGLRILYRDIM